MYTKNPYIKKSINQLSDNGRKIIMYVYIVLAFFVLSPTKFKHSGLSGRWCLLHDDTKKWVLNNNSWQKLTIEDGSLVYNDEWRGGNLKNEFYENAPGK